MLFLFRSDKNADGEIAFVYYWLKYAHTRRTNKVNERNSIDILFI